METGELLLLQVPCTAARQDPPLHQHSPRQTISSVSVPFTHSPLWWALSPRYELSCTEISSTLSRESWAIPPRGCRQGTKPRNPANLSLSLMKQHIALPTVLCSDHLSKRQETCLTILISCQPHKLGKSISSEILKDHFHHLNPFFFRKVMWSHKYSLCFKSLSAYADVHKPWKWRVRK